MSATLRSLTRTGSTLIVAALVLASGCAPKTRGRPFAIQVPLQLQNVVAVDKQGNRIVAGSFAGRLGIAGGELKSAGGTDIYVAKSNKEGAPVFPPQRFGGAGDDAATGVAVDDDGSIVLVGTIQGEVAFGDQRLAAQVRHPGQRAVFVARMDPTGKVAWVRQVAVANLPTQVSVAIGPDHNIVVGATATGMIAKKDVPLALAGQSATLELLSPAGAPIEQPPPSKLQARMIPVGCAHSPCTEGGVLESGCGPDACVAWICGVDPFCCAVAWDSWCVAEVGSVCQRRCDCGTICTQGNPFYFDACNCTAQVYGVDPYCSEASWDSICVSEAVSMCGVHCP
jgi:hypothetical protein